MEIRFRCRLDSVRVYVAGQDRADYGDSSWRRVVFYRSAVTYLRAFLASVFVALVGIGDFKIIEVGGARHVEVVDHSPW